jgi:hypothetical protein
LRIHAYAIGMGTTVYEQIQKAFGLHPISEEVIENNNGAFARFLSRSPGSKDIDRLGTYLFVFPKTNLLLIKSSISIEGSELHQYRL